MSEARRRPAVRTAVLCVTGQLIAFAFPGHAHAQGEGARAYELSPVGSQTLDVYGMFGRGDFDFDPGAPVAGGAELTVNGGILEYARVFALAGKAGTFLASLPFGEARGSISAGTAMRTDSSSGIGDLQLTGAFGIAGSPALSEKEYEAYRPGMAVSLLTRLYLPTGAYERTSPVNLGRNRWAVQLGVPVAYYLGDSFLVPSLTSFELIPSLIGYFDNDEPASGRRSHQAPLIQLEGHLTRNLNHIVWVSLDALLAEGGETTTDGVSDRNRQRSVALGATGSVAVSEVVAATLSYTQEVSRNKSGVSGHVIRLLIEVAL